jgi:hypothetical protein
MLGDCLVVRIRIDRAQVLALYCMGYGLVVIELG